MLYFAAPAMVAHLKYEGAAIQAIPIFTAPDSTDATYIDREGKSAEIDFR